MANPDGEDGAGTVDTFATGLRPILLRVDVAAFRQYLGRWDDVIGDTAALAVQTDAEVRRTMSEMLRRPRQFGLPAWPVTSTPPLAASNTPTWVGTVATENLEGARVGPPTVETDGQMARVESLPQGTVPVARRDHDDVVPVDLPESVYAEVEALKPRGTCEDPSSWAQADFVTGDFVKPNARVPRVVTSSRLPASRRAATRTPPGFQQLDLPFGGR